MTAVVKKDLDWEKLGFSYTKTDWRFLAYWREGNWLKGEMTGDSNIHLNEGSTALHYGQQCFEGLKAYTAKNGRTLLFRPDMNARRLAMSADALMMPAVPQELFIDACIKTVKENLAWVPPYGTGASFYLRPYQIGVGENLGVRPSREYIFSVFGSPVGPYFKNGFAPVKFMISDFDRAAPKGTGGVKVGGNYAASLKPHQIAVDAGFADAIYLDPVTHTKIEEVGAANFFGITADNTFVTPKSPSILPSITKYSLMHIASAYLGMKVEERDVLVENLSEFVEAGACGTAAVITPIGGIYHHNKMHSFFADGKEVGPVITKLYNTLTAIQYGDLEAPEGWIIEVK